MRKKPNKIRVYSGATEDVSSDRALSSDAGKHQRLLSVVKSPTGERKDQQVAENARQIFIDNKQSFGSRRLADRLQKQGFAIGRFKTRCIMRDLKLQVRYPKRFKVTTNSHHNETISPNRLDLQFQIARPNQVWTTDIAYVWTLQGWLYVAVMIDLFSRQVVRSHADLALRPSLANGPLAP